MQPAVLSPRPKRGRPEETRKRIIQAAAECFNAHGLAGVDANRIAHAAGYSNGVFYKHFRDKQEALIAAYSAWVDAEWRGIGDELFSGKDKSEIAARVVDFGASLHARWAGLRGAMIALVAIDPSARKAYRNIQSRQLTLVGELRGKMGRPRKGDLEADAMIMTTLERVYDAMAAGEFEELGLDTRQVRKLATQMLAARLSHASGPA